MKDKGIENKSTFGGISVAAAYIMWGILTIFWSLLSDVNPVYILAHRIVWSMVFMGVYVIIFKKTDAIKAVFKNKKILMQCFVCGVLVTINWGVYIVAVNGSKVLDASLGYFIEPVLVALIGVIAFKEKMSKFEKITFCFAVIGIVYMVISTKTVPTLALLIAGSFALYGAVKKRIVISAQISLFMETLLVMPFAVAFIIFAEAKSAGAVGVLHSSQFLLLPACGIVTSIPLLLFNIGVKKIPYYISGILMYINPLIQFFMGIFYFNEPIDSNKLIAFAIIGVGILFTVLDKIGNIKKTNFTKNNIDKIHS